MSKKKRFPSISDMTRFSPPEIMRAFLRLESMKVIELMRDEYSEIVFSPEGEISVRPTDLFDHPDLWESPNIDKAKFQHDLERWEQARARYKKEARS